MTCLYCGLCLAGYAQKQPVSKQEIMELKAVYTEFDKAAQIQDTTTLEKFLDDNYVLESGSKKLNKKQALKGMTDDSGLIKEFTRAESRIETVEKIGGSFVVTLTFTTVGKVVIPSGRILEFTTSTRSTDLWTKDQSGNWRQKLQISRGTDVFIDAKKSEG